MLASIASLKIAVTVVPVATPVAPLAGVTLLTVGGVVSADAMFTVRLTAVDVAVLPAASYALAVQLCVPLSLLVNAQAYVYGLAVAVPFNTPPS